MTGKGEKRFRFLKALLCCLFIAGVLTGLPRLLVTRPFWDVSISNLHTYFGNVFTDVGIAGILYWLIYLMFVGVAAAVRKIKGASGETGSEASGKGSEDSGASSGGGA